MFFDTSKKKIKTAGEEFFRKMDFPGEIEVEEREHNSFYLNLKTEDPQMLIGRGGQTLGDIQYLLRRILNKQEEGDIKKDLEREYPERIYLEVDVNNYRKKKKEYLRELAHNVADEVTLTKKEKTLEPMSSYERRIIHIELSGRKDIKTESSGQEPERRVVIKSITQQG